MNRDFHLKLILLMVFVLYSHVLYAVDLKNDSYISDSSIEVILSELKNGVTSKQSSTRLRRAYKGFIRKAQTLIETQPTASNRFRVLSLILKTQHDLLAIDKSSRNRKALYTTCEALLMAPEDQAGFRFDADVMLSERDLSARDADVKERIKSLIAIVQKYRDTPAELKSLLSAISLAPKLGAYDFKNECIKGLSSRFAGDPIAIAKRRKLMGSSSIDILFSGNFERLDGKTISFPFDRIGHPYFVLFWSQNNSRSIDKLKQLAEQQKQHPDLFEFYSLNLDELADGGLSFLEKAGLKCTVLRLPYGKKSETYLTYGLHEPSALIVNQFGHAIISPTQASHINNKDDQKKFAHSNFFDEFSIPTSVSGPVTVCTNYDRYHSQIRSLLIGDFLVAAEKGDIKNKEAGGLIIEQTIGSIDTCFIKAPFRYRLSRPEAYKQYKKIKVLCTEALEKYSKRQSAWRIRNYQIIALMGMSSISGSSEYFEQAVKVSHEMVAHNLTSRVNIIARFCIAKNALRQGSDSAKNIITQFIKNCGGTSAKPRAHNAACILAMHADSKDLYLQYRSIVLKLQSNEISLAPMTSFLRNRLHQFYLFRGNPNYYLYSREYRFAERRYMIDDGIAPTTTPLPPFTLKTLEGKTVSLPNLKSDRLTLLLFVEPTTSANNSLSSAIYKLAEKPTKRNKNPQPTGNLADGYALSQQSSNNGIQVITVFLSDEVKRVNAIIKKFNLPGVIMMVPGGINNRIVNQLGILSADRNVNSVLIRRNGTIAWFKNGIPYNMSGVLQYITTVGWNSNIDICDTEAGFRALKNKAYQKAEQLFAGSYLLPKEKKMAQALTKYLLQARAERDSKWKSSRFHGKSLAQLGLKNFDIALQDIEMAISIHFKHFNHDKDNPCSSMIHLLNTKAKVLAATGRSSEAKSARAEASKEATNYPTQYSRIRGYNVPYERFEDRLSVIAKEIK